MTSPFSPKSFSSSLSLFKQTRKRGRKRRKEWERKKEVKMNEFLIISNRIHLRHPRHHPSFHSLSYSPPKYQRHLREWKRERKEKKNRRKKMKNCLPVHQTHLNFFIPKTPTIYFFQQQIEAGEGEDTFEFTHE